MAEFIVKLRVPTGTLTDQVESPIKEALRPQEFEQADGGYLVSVAVDADTPQAAETLAVRRIGGAFDYTLEGQPKTLSVDEVQEADTPPT